MDKVPVIKEKIITWIYHDNMKKAIMGIWSIGFTSINSYKLWLYKSTN